MIKDIELLKRFEYRQIRETKLSHRESLRIFASMWQEAVDLGVLPLKDPLEGIEVDIRIAKILNQGLCSKK
ncbi:MAG TPA: hypothetical protein ENH19_02470 [Actinobacteria bacterium]|nr:hypothetical protein [Actinomycetes bacterium]HEX21502.1 hypothetical protein [Actinomycetota bacterium]